MTWITQVQRKTTAAMKLSSLHFCLFIFHWEVSPGRKLSVLTLCAFSKHLSIVYLQTARLFSANLTAKMTVLFRMLWHWVSAVVANEQTMDDIKRIVNIHFSFQQAVSSIGIPFHNAYSVVNSQWMKWMSLASFEIHTRRLEVETSKLNGVSGMMQWHFFAVGETSFPSFRFCSFSAEQTANYNSFWLAFFFLVLKLSLYNLKACLEV